MISEEILDFREKLRNDKDNRDIRRRLHENYEWLESFWQQKFRGNNGEQQFCNAYGNFYWGFIEIQGFAKNLALLRPVGSSKNDFMPTENILRATYFLKYNADLFDVEEIEIDVGAKTAAEKWNGSQAKSFGAVFDIVKQIRNNLFHGRKIELGEIQYKRNMELILIATDFTEFLLDNLVDAERDSIKS